MTRTVIVGSWGANLAVRLPREAAEQAGFERGTTVELETRLGEIVIRSARRRYSLKELLEGATPDAMREAFDWGEDIGREAID